MCRRGAHDGHRGPRSRHHRDNDRRNLTSVILGLGLAAVVVLLAAHAVFVAGEFSLVAAPRERVERSAAQGDRRAQRVLAALRSLSFQLSGAQLGITMTSLLVGFLVEAILADALAPWIESLGISSGAVAHAVAAGMALSIATTTEMVLAELVPKNYAIARPLGSARRYVGPLWWFSWALRPLILFLNASANWLVRRLGVEPREELRSVRTIEELELLIRTSGERGRSTTTRPTSRTASASPPRRGPRRLSPRSPVPRTSSR